MSLKSILLLEEARKAFVAREGIKSGTCNKNPIQDRK